LSSAIERVIEVVEKSAEDCKPRVTFTTQSASSSGATENDSPSLYISTEASSMKTGLDELIPLTSGETGGVPMVCLLPLGDDRVTK
jgi:hypothetical protein